jgi:Fe-S-cluster containining protein
MAAVPRWIRARWPSLGEPLVTSAVGFGYDHDEGRPCFFPGASKLRPIDHRQSEPSGMSKGPSALPVIESCDGCGACCQVVTAPPFYRVFDEASEDAWERLKADRPDVLAELLADYQARPAAGGPFYGTPCIWLHAATRRCLHYDYRPRACRAFEVGGADCRDARRRAGVNLESDWGQIR